MDALFSPMAIKVKLFFTEASEEAQKVRDRLHIFAEELELAKKWDRPSILIATFRSDYVREYAETVLERLISASNDKVFRYRVEKGQFDIPLELRESPNRKEMVFFISDLRRGGGKSGRNAYRALNLRREYLVEERIRAVFWLTAVESRGLPRFAPDFWAFRHRVIELDDFYFQSHRTLPKAVEDMIWHDHVAQNVDIKKFLPLLKNTDLLAQKMDETGSGFPNMKQLYLFAYVLWKTGSNQEALELLDRGLKVAVRANNPRLQAKLLSAAGIVHFRPSDFQESVAALEQASSLNPDDPIVWNNLSLPLYHSGRVEKAISAIHTAMELKPRFAGCWRTLGSLYYDLGWLDEARLAYQRCVKYNPQDPEAWHFLGTIFMELEDRKQAFHAFRKAYKIDPVYKVPDD